MSSDAPLYDLPAGYQHIYSGKVRDLYSTPEDRLLFVASDRISAYDWVLPTTIPDKGRILTQLSLWWFKQLEGVVPNHLRSTSVPAAVKGRAMICDRLEMLPIECVVRGYLTGSGLTTYLESRSICGLGLPPGLKDGS
ncbi:MAG: phosphoribosylaminoimidazolesuccinocarboxamide synthase, partial [Actinobacteria bacterium]|nr:phosphoribosylaminoimidazolesuccinocarboxamide synthase [Actinomycetota bacterium]